MKRDIRSQDHEPLQRADLAELPFLIIYLLEPSVIAHPDTSLRHLQFQYHSIQAFNRQYDQTGKRIHLFHAEAKDVLGYLIIEFDIRTIYSYQESGIALTWERDKWVHQFCKNHGILWKEFQRDGVIRGIQNRQDWDRRWFQVMHSKLIENQPSTRCLSITHPFPLYANLQAQLEDYPASFQPAGEQQAWRYLHSFVESRGHVYHKMISKPAESRKSCSRLSPYLAWGNLSIRQAYQFVRQHELYTKNKFALSGMLTRLKWHCHFIQKFEMECSYETHCVNAGYELLSHENNRQWIQAWKKGLTGFPLVDACMRCLIATGWINFRMRAMLVSVLCHHLDADWREGVYHLAQLFLDYEPGIHYTQFQMQAGTTGINTVRMYNPVKQSMEHDSHGEFIKKWVPELRNVPSEHIHEPWKMTAMEQSFAKVSIPGDYPSPIVELSSAAKMARDKIWGHRKNEQVRKENARIVKKHTRAANRTN